MRNASRNDITCGVMANVKGSPYALAEGMDYAANPPTEWAHDYDRPRMLETQEQVDEVSAIPVPAIQRVVWRIGDTTYWNRVPIRIEREYV